MSLLLAFEILSSHSPQQRRGEKFLAPQATMLQVMALPKTGNVSLQLWRAERITRERGILEWITNTLLENKHQGKYLLFPGYCHKKNFLLY